MKPTFVGYVPETHEALLLFQAVVDGVLEPISRRPQDQERRDMIKSGSVFVFYQNQSGIRRWTDHINWSPSRILGNFLIYRQLDKPTMRERKDSLSSFMSHHRSDSVITYSDEISPNHSPPSGGGPYAEYSHSRGLSSGSAIIRSPRPGSFSSARELCADTIQGDERLGLSSAPSGSLADTTLRPDKTGVVDWSDLDDESAAYYHDQGEEGQFNPEWSLYGSLVQGNPQKFAYLPGGLVKKTISVQFGGDTLHMISYYSATDVCNKVLRIPSSDPQIAAGQINAELLNNSGSLRVPVNSGRRSWIRPLSPIPAYANMSTTFPLAPSFQAQIYAPSNTPASVLSASYGMPSVPFMNRDKVPRFADSGHLAPGSNSEHHAMDPVLMEQSQSHQRHEVNAANPYAYQMQHMRPQSSPVPGSSVYTEQGYIKTEDQGRVGVLHAGPSTSVGFGGYSQLIHDFGGYAWHRDNSAPDSIPLSPVSQDHHQRLEQLQRLGGQPAGLWLGRHVSGPSQDHSESAHHSLNWISARQTSYDQGQARIPVQNWGQQPTPLSSNTNTQDFAQAQPKSFQGPIKSPSRPTPPLTTDSASQ